MGNQTAIYCFRRLFYARQSGRGISAHDRLFYNWYDQSQKRVHSEDRYVLIESLSLRSQNTVDLERGKIYFANHT